MCPVCYHVCVCAGHLLRWQSYMYSTLTKAAQVLISDDAALVSSLITSGTAYLNSLSATEALVYSAPPDQADFPSDLALVVSLC